MQIVYGSTQTRLIPFFLYTSRYFVLWGCICVTYFLRKLVLFAVYIWLKTLFPLTLTTLTNYPVIKVKCDYKSDFKDANKILICLKQFKQTKYFKFVGQ